MDSYTISIVEQEPNNGPQWRHTVTVSPDGKPLGPLTTTELLVAFEADDVPQPSVVAAFPGPGGSEGFLREAIDEAKQPGFEDSLRIGNNITEREALGIVSAAQHVGAGPENLALIKQLIDDGTPEGASSAAVAPEYSGFAYQVSSGALEVFHEFFERHVDVV